MQYTRKIDQYLVLILFILSGIVLHNLLNIKYVNPLIADDRVELGVIVNVQKTVRTKAVDHASWIDASESNQIYNNDKVYTDNSSSATIAFKSGSELIINEDSLIKLEVKNNIFNLDVEKGSFLANLNSDSEVFLLLLDGREYRLKSKKGSVKISDKKLSILSGEATIYTNKSELVLKAGEITNLENLKLEAMIDFPSDLSFIDAQTEYLPQIKTTSITWKYAAPLDVFISSDVDFKKVQKYSNSKNKVEFPAAEGVYYIKFFDVKNNTYSSVRSVHYVFEKAPVVEFSEGPYFKGQKIYGQINNETFSTFGLYLNGKKIQKVNSDFVLELTTQGMNTIQIIGEEEGRHYAIKSKVFDFEVNEFPVAGPKILSPKNAEEFYFYAEDKIEIKLASEYEIDYGVRLNDKIINAMSSEIDYSVKENETIVMKSFYRINEKYIYGEERQVFVFLDNYSSDQSKGKKFVLKKPGQEVNFDWEEKQNENEKTRYLLEVSDTSNFSRINRKIETQDSSMNLKFDDVGEKFWRVKIINNDGRIEYSKPEKLILLKPEPPPSPILKKIIQKRVTLNNLIFKLLDFIIPSALAQEDVEISDKIEWDKIEGVEKYKIEILNVKTNKIIKSITQKENQFHLDSLKPGTYKYRVASIDFWGQQGKFSEYFELEIRKVSKEIRLISPRHLMSESPAIVRFEWAREFGFEGNYLLEISHDLNFSSSAKYPSKLNFIEIDLKPFQGQKIFWRVSTTKNDRVVSKRRVLNVDVIKTLDQKTAITKLQDTKKWSVFIHPNKKSIELRDGKNDLKIDGFDLIDFGINFFPFDIGNSFYEINFEKSSGKVFNELDFSSNTLEILKQFRLGSYVLGGGVSFKYATNYSVNNNRVNQGNDLSSNIILKSSLIKSHYNFAIAVVVGQELGFQLIANKNGINKLYINTVGVKFSYYNSSIFGDTISVGPVLSF